MTNVLPGTAPTAQTSPVARTALAPKSDVSPDGPFGLATTVQDVPFQCSVRVTRIGIVPVTSSRYPIAQTSVDDTAVTAASTSCANGLGLVTSDQAPPFQCMTTLLSGWFVPSVVNVLPTAHASEGPIAATPLSTVRRGLNVA